MAGDDVISKVTHLTKKYPNAYSNFYGSDTPCVYKSGPYARHLWPRASNSFSPINVKDRAS